MSGRRGFGARDQKISAFGPILARLCDVARLPGAVLVDPDGEAVDYAGSAEPFELKVMAAEWRNVMNQVRSSRVVGMKNATEITVRAARRSFALFTLAEGYAVVLELPRHSFGVSRRAVWEALRCISEEAMLQPPPGWELDRWELVDVREESPRSRRPAALWRDGAWVSLEILGRSTADDLLRRECAYRVRLAGGEEVTLVRERLGAWFADFLSGSAAAPVSRR